MSKLFHRVLMLLGVATLAAGCSAPTKNVDYAAFKESHPRSIVVLPPLNNSPDVNATFGMLAQATLPLAESGYYVVPITLMAETFRQNGLTAAHDVHEVPAARLREIFGADAALYMTVSRYGTTYMVFDSAAIVTADARLVDLKTGQTLWSGSATASSSESNNQQGGLVALLVVAVIKQIANNVADKSFDVAGITSQRLLGAGRPNGLLYGPRSPRYGTD